MMEEKRCQHKFESWKLHELMLSVIAYWTGQKKPSERQGREGPGHISCRTTEKLYVGTRATKKL